MGRILNGTVRFGKLQEEVKVSSFYSSRILYEKPILCVCIFIKIHFESNI